MSDSKRLEEYYYEEIYLPGSGMSEFKGLSGEEKRQIEQSEGFQKWKIEKAANEFADTFAETMSAVLDNDTVLFIVLFVATVVFLLLGGLVALN